MLAHYAVISSNALTVSGHLANAVICVVILVIDMLISVWFIYKLYAPHTLLKGP